MMNTFALALSLLLAKHSLSASLTDWQRDPELLPNFFQGDLVNRPSIAKWRRNVISNTIYHWPNRTVFYFIENGTFDEPHLQYIRRSMHRIEKISCVKFVEASSDQKYFVNITSDEDGCHCEDIGWRNHRTKVNLGVGALDQGCFRMGSIIHELLHVLGFEHQHVAQDRDEYVQIVWENISPENIINFFNNETYIGWNNYGEEYDYGSVMHYISNAFAKNISQPTIVALKTGGSKMGQRRGLSKTDVRKLNKMYKCPGYV
ncbi:seminal metalloprotease 1-like isoform X1 [Drosophila subobscura]|uniref:seminal metalloprotease 1-like isoform X1 n=1 Tax=Drosophila subobscura TaxID=7241 RepID=UPI00155A7A20|nr:seminal metalloprotease 1-like isoform X1 [Drosophila subobscura]